MVNSVEGSRYGSAQAIFLFVSVLASGSFPLFGVDFSFSDVIAEFSNVPGETQNSSVYKLGYRFSEDFFSFVRYKGEYSAIDSGVANLANSLVLTKKQEIVIDALPLNFRLAKKGLGDITVGIGGNVTRQNVVELGHFAVSSGSNPANQIFNNWTEVYFFSPIILIGAGLDLGDLNIECQGYIIPYYWYNYNQNIEIKPLVSQPANIALIGSGSPFLEGDLRVRLFSLVGADIEYKFQNIAFQELKLQNNGDGTGAFLLEKSSYQIHDFKGVLSIAIPIVENKHIKIGFGKQFNFIYESATAETLTQNDRFIFEVGLE